MMRRLLILGLVAMMASSLAACGRKGKLIPPEGSTYPHRYPNIVYPDGQNGPEPQGSEQK